MQASTRRGRHHSSRTRASGPSWRHLWTKSAGPPSSTSRMHSCPATELQVNYLFIAVFRIRIHRIHVFFALPDPDPLVRGMDPDTDPDPSIIMPWIILVCELNCVKKIGFLLASWRCDHNSRIRIQDSYPDPDPLVSGMDPRIRIYTKMSWLRKTIV